MTNDASATTDADDAKFTEPRCRIALVLLMLAALALRLATLDFALPFAQEPDPHILGQVERLSQDVVTDEDIFYSSIYPHLLARCVMALGDATRRPDGLETLTLDEQLAAASRLHLQGRLVIALFSILIIPATWWIARAFLERKWALFAAALAAASTLALQFGQMARPHAAAGALIALSVAASMQLRRDGNLRAFAVAGLFAALAIACLTNGVVALVPAGTAFVLHVVERKRWLEWRLALPLALLALAVWAFYPFLFVPRPAGEPPPPEDGTFALAWQTIDLHDFAGQGFPTLFMTLWFYEPVALVLALVGLGAWLVSGRDSSAAARSRRKDLLVALSFALVYAIVIGLYRRNQQRFVLPLVPFVAVLAAYGMRAIATRLRAFTVALVVVALAVPTLACLGFTRTRTHPQTLELLAAWIREHVDREHERVAIHLPWDVPLAREHTNLFEADGAKKPISLSPWLAQQQRWMDEIWRGERWNIESLYYDRKRWPEIARDPDAFVASLGADFVVVPAGQGPGVNAMIKAVREALVRAGGRIVLELPAETRPPTSGLEGLDTPHFTYFALTANWFGPQLAVFDMRRKPSEK